MPILFNDLLRSEGVDPEVVKLVRHADTRHGAKLTPYWLWRTDRGAFHLYQSLQEKEAFQHALKLAVFLSTPFAATLFVGMYDVDGFEKCPAGIKDPLSGWDGEANGALLYRLTPTNDLLSYKEKLSIDWGGAYITWIQYAKNSNKPIVEILRKSQQRDFPGYLKLAFPLSEVMTLEPAWIDRLREARGVYVLSCPITKELYVGSATGEGGFYERWYQHAKVGGDAKVLRSREPSDYQVAIVEVAGSSASRQDILHAEHLWMQKLQTNDMGLNGGMLRDGKEQPVTVLASPASAARP